MTMQKPPARADPFVWQSGTNAHFIRLPAVMAPAVMVMEHFRSPSPPLSIPPPPSSPPAQLRHDLQMSVPFLSSCTVPLSAPHLSRGSGPACRQFNAQRCLACEVSKPSRCHKPSGRGSLLVEWGFGFSSLYQMQLHLLQSLGKRNVHSPASLVVMGLPAPSESHTLVSFMDRR